MEEIVNKIGNITKVYANIFEDEARMQVKKMANYEPYLNSKIRIMPDAHAGKGCVIGTTMTLEKAVTPNLVGVDIGCLDCDTEVLTPNGWIKISDYDGQKILQYDPNTDTGVFEIPALYIIKDCEYLKSCANKIGWGRVYHTPREAFASLIDKVGKKGDWDKNPFVFVYDFELVK